jgi:two-component response regulator
MNINIALCDDDVSFIQEMDTMFLPYIFNSKNEIHLDKYSKVTDLFNALASGTEYNIFFLDVEIADYNGIDVAKKITKNKKTESYFIFISNYPEYMQDSFSVHPYQYFEKPIKKEKLYTVLDEIAEKEKKRHLSITVLETESSEQVPVDVMEILFIETTNARLQKLRFHLINRVVTVKGTISDWITKLNAYPFLICYKGILVNVYHIHLIKDNKIVLSNGEALPISRKYVNQIKNEMVNVISTYKI